VPESKLKHDRQTAINPSGIDLACDPVIANFLRNKPEQRLLGLKNLLYSSLGPEGMLKHDRRTAGNPSGIDIACDPVVAYFLQHSM